MKIVHIIDEFFYQLFPVTKDLDSDHLIAYISDYYTVQGVKPTVSLTDNKLVINLNLSSISKNSQEYSKVVSLCEAGKFQEALPIINALIARNPTNSEYHRILGQIYSEQGKYNLAIDQLIEALRWDAHNKWALIMMGNIQAKHQHDLETAVSFYDQAVKVDPQNNIAINNIGAMFMEMGRYNEAEKYFQKSLAVDAQFLNTRYALTLLSEKQGNYKRAFEMASDILKSLPKKLPIYGSVLSIAINASKSLIKEHDITILIDAYIDQLEDLSGKKIVKIEDSSIPTLAKIEIAENYNRNEHIIKYKPQKEGYLHLIMHELVHLDLICQARKIGENKIFTTSSKGETSFKTDFESHFQRLASKYNLDSHSLSKVIGDVFTSINSQAYNTPIDLFIESYLYTTFKELRPHQFISLLDVTTQAYETVINSKVQEIVPLKIFTATKIFNLVIAMQVKELYGIDFVNEIKSSASEINQAKKFFQEFKEYQVDTNAGEEYELVQNWSEDLGIGKYFELKEEFLDTKIASTPLDFIDNLEKDPYELESSEHDLEKERKMEKFLKDHTKDEINMTVMKYMIEALQYFKGYSKDQIQPIAVEIATLGMHGISPEKNGYILSAFPNEKFDGYRLLSYYYVSWILFDSSMHKLLQLPFDKEFELAQAFMTHE